LAGGLNLHVYAPSPVRWVDPLGLQGWDAFPYKNDPVIQSEYNKAVAAAESAMAPREVYICKRPLDISWIPDFAAKNVLPEHTWLKTSTMEAGLGGDCPTPGQGCADIPFVTQVKVVDHSGQSNQPGASCILLNDVNENCVNNILSSNISRGTWTPINQCKSFVSEVVSACSIKPEKSLLDRLEIFRKVYTQ
jgi:hypothetical protein